jgi:hypothetical protein
MVHAYTGRSSDRRIAAPAGVGSRRDPVGQPPLPSSPFAHNLLRRASPRLVKETLVPATAVGYPFLQAE